jgi:hypothetical protein
MNLFEKAKKIETDIASKTRKGSNAPLSSTVAMPFFKGNMRKGDSTYLVKGIATRKDDKGKVIKVAVQYDSRRKPLAGTFLLSYFSCLAYDICKEAKQPCTTYLVQALIEHEGFTLDEYSQGKIQGASRIAKHLKDIAIREKLAISISDKGLITGLEKYACKVLQAY